VNGVKALGYGESGIGKTTLAATMPKPIIISGEEGLLSLSHVDIPFIEIDSIKSLTESFKWVRDSKEAEVYESVIIDSISDVAEVLLAEYKKKVKDARQAYGQMGDDIAETIRRFRGLKGRNVYFIAKVKKTTDELSGAVNYSPSIPGQVAMQNLPYFFDLVFYMQFGKGPDGKKVRQIVTEGDRQWIAKDRSNRLDKIEVPDLGVIINKIIGD